MLDLSVIILTYNEEIHIKRCLDNIAPLAKDVYIIDSFSNDNTITIAKGYSNVTILQNKWENNHAKQFNWGLDNAPISTKWVMRIDADEYLTDELICELKERLPYLDNDITGIVLNRQYYFLGKWMKHGIQQVKMLRIFRTGTAVSENRLMDEHIGLLKGKAISFNHDFVDNNLNDISWWAQKHVGYAIREAVSMLDFELDLTGSTTKEESINISKQAKSKRILKHKYAKQPLFWRAFAYFLYRYILKMGFLDGKEGFLWHFMQGWWYRTMVDAKIFEIKKACGSDKRLIKQYLSNHYNIIL